MSCGGSGYMPWPVEPAKRVGSFSLGMGVNEALAAVQRMGSLDRGDFCFDERRIFESDLCLSLPSLGLQLCFDGFRQDLRVIIVRLHPGSEADDDRGEASMLPLLSYGGRVFAGGKRKAPTLKELCQMCGPTYIGDFAAQDGGAAYFLRYPGLAFECPLPEDLLDDLAKRGEHPVELPGRAPPVAVRMWVFAASSPSYLEPASSLPDDVEPAIVCPALGVELTGRLLRLGAMPQDVFSDFGPPEQVCVKDVDAVRIHSCHVPPVQLSGRDYFFNYFHLGMDVLFDGCVHVVKKIILHTNSPTHGDFSRYSRCFFQIPVVPTADEVEAEACCELVLAGIEGPEVQPEPPAAAVPPQQQPNEAPEEAEVEAEVEAEKSRSSPGRKVSKRERKVARKQRKAATGGATPSSSQQASPELSVLSTPPSLLSALADPEACPLADANALPAAAIDTDGAAVANAEDLLGLGGSWDLPTPALPLSHEGGSEGECEHSGPGRPAKLAAAGAAGSTQEPRPDAGGACPPAGDCWQAIDVRWSWSEIQRALGLEHTAEKPMVVGQRGSMPFGSTRFHALPGLAFEVMQNGYLASLTVFSVSKEELPAPLSEGSERRRRALLAGG
eukprot:TRINITY_DN29535_c0_g2_i1.p1 TRINITY_DN29535_c0_g2~~TRINITY_DN29535_c0_g2_i1.p1  ORF type:complete len:613 (-),score=136.80 TRINITY_DN29535_c0_g2_i1:8-1846(-)